MQLISPSQGERVSGDEIETFLREDTTRTFHFGSRSRRLNSLENLPDRVRFLRTFELIVEKLQDFDWASFILDLFFQIPFSLFSFSRYEFEHYISCWRQ